MFKKISQSLMWKTFLQILFISMLITSAMIALGYREMRRSTEYYFKSHTEQLADSAAHSVRTSDVKKIVDMVMPVYESVQDHRSEDLSAYAPVLETEEYKNLLRTMEELRQTRRIKYVTIILPDHLNRRLVYIADADALLAGEGVNYRLPGESRPMNEGEIEGFADRGIRISAYRYFVRGDRNNEIWSAGSAVTDDNGDPIAYLFVDITTADAVDMAKRYLRHILPFMFVLMLLIAMIYVTFFGSTLVKPVRTISRAADHYIENRTAGNDEQTDFFSRLEISTGGDEIERLADSMTKMENELNSYLDNIKVISAESARIRTELGLAKQIQEDTLPSTFPPFPKRGDIDLFALMNPAKEVGGDFYDFFLVDEDHLALVVADVSGKGVPAALFMMTSKTLINTNARGSISPARTLEKVNSILCENNKLDYFVTCWLGIVELSTGKTVYANAGHENPLLFHDGKWSYITTKHGFVLGGLEDMEYKDYTITLDKDDILFQYTDGVTEACNDVKEQYGPIRLLGACKKACRDSAQTFLTDVRADISAFTGDADQFDDITMLCFTYRNEKKA